MLYNTTWNRACGQGYSLPDPSSHLQASALSCFATCLEPCTLHQCSNPTLVTVLDTRQQLVFPKSQLPVFLVAFYGKGLTPVPHGSSAHLPPTAPRHLPLRQWALAEAWLAALVCHLSALKWGWWAKSLLWVPRC